MLRPSLWEKHQWDPVFSVVENLLECLEKNELSAAAEEPTYYCVGLVSGLARRTYCLAAMSTSYLALSLTPQLIDQLLSPFEAVRPGTEVFLHNMMGSWPHWLDKDVRRLRLRFLPNYTIGKVATFNRVPFDN